MAVVYLAPGPFGAGGQFFDSNGKVLNAGLLNTYAAGGSTPTATYTTSAGSVQNANPIVLGPDGRPANEIWLIAGTSYKFVLTDSLANILGTYDNLSGVNDPATSAPSGVLTNVAGTNTITATASPVITAYAKGQRWLMTAAATITAAATLNISSVGARNLMKRTSGGIVATVANDIISGNSYELFDDGTQLIIEGIRAYSQGAIIASAATINLDTATGDYVHVSGTVTITAITLAQGEERTLVFDGALTFTNGASLILPAGANITTAAGAMAIVRGEASGVVRCIYYTNGLDTPHGFAIFTGNGTWTVPTGVTTIEVDGAAGGASGGGAANGANTAAGGGSAGQSTVGQNFTVVPAAVATITIGTGGAAPTAGNNPGNAGVNTTVTGAFALTLTGGAAGAGAAAGAAGAGGASIGAGSAAGAQGNNTPQLGGAGGGNQWAAPAIPSSNSVAGLAGNIYGGAGAGGSSSGAGATSGGAGAAGFLRIRW